MRARGTATFLSIREPAWKPSFGPSDSRSARSTTASTCSSEEFPTSRGTSSDLEKHPWTVSRLDRQVMTCLLLGHGRCLRGTERAGEAGNSRRTARAGWPDVIRALRPTDDEAWSGHYPSGDLAAPRHAGISRSRHDQTGRSIQVPLSEHRPAEGHCRTMVDPGSARSRTMKIVLTSV